VDEGARTLDNWGHKAKKDKNQTIRDKTMPQQKINKFNKMIDLSNRK